MKLLLLLFVLQGAINEPLQITSNAKPIGLQIEDSTGSLLTCKSFEIKGVERIVKGCKMAKGATLDAIVNVLLNPPHY